MKKCEACEDPICDFCLWFDEDDLRCTKSGEKTDYLDTCRYFHCYTLPKEEENAEDK